LLGRGSRWTQLREPGAPPPPPEEGGNLSVACAVWERVGDRIEEPRVTFKRNLGSLTVGFTKSKLGTSQNEERKDIVPLNPVKKVVTRETDRPGLVPRRVQKRPSPSRGNRRRTTPAADNTKKRSGKKRYPIHTGYQGANLRMKKSIILDQFMTGLV